MNLISKGRAVVYLMGGLGNNLFQLNMAYELKESGSNVTINVGLLSGGGFVSKFLNWTDHNSYTSLCKLGLLEGFNVEKRVSPFVLFFGFLSKITKQVVFKVGFYGLTSPNLMAGCSGHFFGYYHNINVINKHFVESVKSGLCNVLGNRKYLWGDVNLVRCGVPVVHVRGGDFIEDGENILTYEYYYNALKKVRYFTRRSFVVATNDRNYVNDLFGLKSIRFTASRDAIDDFILIREAKFKILSNSTFAWWAAELGDLDSKIIEVNPYYVALDWCPLSGHQRILIPRR